MALRVLLHMKVALFYHVPWLLWHITSRISFFTDGLLINGKSVGVDLFLRFCVKLKLIKMGSKKEGGNLEKTLI